jgi:predicted nucleotidyltransferase
MATRREMTPAEIEVDVAVLYVTTPPRTLRGLPFDLEAELEKLVGRPVQVVVLNHVSVDLVHRVLRDGKLLLDRDRSRRIRFEVKARNDFFDLQPVLAEYRFPRAPTT